MITGLIRWWQARQRAIDLQILWPSCRRVAPDLDTARRVFAHHAFRDKAWRALGEDEIIRAIDRLE